MLQQLNILKSKLLQAQKGQSLVEMVIITPLLIFLLLGVFEVGFALRGHLALTNVNREITRFAVRPGYMDFSTKASAAASYTRVRDWAKSSIGEQLDLDFDSPAAATTLIASHLVIDTGAPCAKQQGNKLEEDPECSTISDCDVFLNPAQLTFTYDDVIVHPGITGQEFQAQSFGPTQTVTGLRPSRLDYEDLAAELTLQNNKFNCEVIKKNGVPSANNVIATEVYHDQPQLFGFPFISNPFTDPVPLYTHTVMRLIGASRSSGTSANITDGIDTVGPVCFAFPTTTKRSIIQAATIGQTIDILEGEGGDNKGWLNWNPGEDDENYLNLEWQYYQMSMNDYTDPSEHNDHALNIGDYVSSLGGTVDSIDTRTIIEGYAGTGFNLVIPVWDDLSPDGFKTWSNPNSPPPQVDAYKVWNFILVRIEKKEDIQLTPHKNIYATYLGLADICQ